MDRLSVRDRLVLKLRFAEGLSGPAIAEALSISHNAANLAVLKALRRLERILTTAAPEMWAPSS